MFISKVLFFQVFFYLLSTECGFMNLNAALSGRTEGTPFPWGVAPG
jgi:hypothetical protein